MCLYFWKSFDMFFLFFIFRIWDLSLEKDEEEEAEFKTKMKEQVNVPQDLPPQLLFVHQVFITFQLFCARVVGLLKLMDVSLHVVWLVILIYVQ